jgi:hypothetical protein
MGVWVAGMMVLIAVGVDRFTFAGPQEFRTMASTKAITTLNDRVRRKIRLVICPSILGGKYIFQIYHCPDN